MYLLHCLGMYIVVFVQDCRICRNASLTESTLRKAIVSGQVSINPGSSQGLRIAHRVSDDLKSFPGCPLVSVHV